MSLQSTYGGPAEALAEHRDQQAWPRGALVSTRDHLEHKAFSPGTPMEEETPLSYQQSQCRALVPKGLQRAPLPPGTEVAFGQMGGDRQGGVRQLLRGKISIDSGKATKREKLHRENSQVTMGALLDRTSQGLSL